MADKPPDESTPDDREPEQVDESTEPDSPGEHGLHRRLAPVLWLTVLVVAVTPALATSVPGRILFEPGT